MKSKFRTFFLFIFITVCVHYFILNVLSYLWTIIRDHSIANSPFESIDFKIRIFMPFIWFLETTTIAYWYLRTFKNELSLNFKTVSLLSATFMNFIFMVFSFYSAVLDYFDSIQFVFEHSPFFYLFIPYYIPLYFNSILPFILAALFILYLVHIRAHCSKLASYCFLLIPVVIMNSGPMNAMVFITLFIYHSLLFAPAFRIHAIHSRSEFSILLILQCILLHWFAPF